MSDYVHEKVIRLPFPKDLLNDDEDVYDSFSKIIKSLDEEIRKKFKFEYTDKNVYIDWCFYSTYGENSGDFGYARHLNENELNIIKPYFDLLGFKYDSNDLRFVEYCYYNCCEPTDYYDIIDESQNLLK